MTEVIASRTLYTTVGGQIRKISIHFGKPTQIESGDWMCECIIEGIGVDIQAPRPGMGIDAVQAIVSALQSVGVTLEASNLPLSITRDAFLVGASPDPRKLGDLFPRRIHIQHGLFEAIERLEGEAEG